MHSLLWCPPPHWSVTDGDALRVHCNTAVFPKEDRGTLTEK